MRTLLIVLALFALTCSGRVGVEGSGPRGPMPPYCFEATYGPYNYRGVGCWETLKECKRRLDVADKHGRRWGGVKRLSSCWRFSRGRR